MPDPTLLTGSVRGLLLFDIGESIDLAQLRTAIGTVPRRREPAFRHPAPEYVRFERPPVTQQLGVRNIFGSPDVEVRVRYFDYGVASVELQLPFTTDWSSLVALANRWILAPDLETSARKLLEDVLQPLRAAIQKPYSSWVSEDYYVVQVEPIQDGRGDLVTAEDLLRERGNEIAQVVRGETAMLANSERQEVLQSSMSYYPSDLLVLGWVGAFLYDTRDGAGPTVEILDYGNTQLLEFRYYDDVLTDVLADVYKELETRRTMWARWKLARRAESLNTIRLDYEELVERTENAIKFLSDMFYARVYRLAAARIGV